VKSALTPTEKSDGGQYASRRPSSISFEVAKRQGLGHVTAPRTCAHSSPAADPSPIAGVGETPDRTVFGHLGVQLLLPSRLVQAVSRESTTGAMGVSRGGSSARAHEHTGRGVARYSADAFRFGARPRRASAASAAEAPLRQCVLDRKRARSGVDPMLIRPTWGRVVWFRCGHGHRRLTKENSPREANFESRSHGPTRYSRGMGKTGAAQTSTAAERLEAFRSWKLS